jgi:hypothetical protein
MDRKKLIRSLLTCDGIGADEKAKALIQLLLVPYLSENPPIIAEVQEVLAGIRKTK